MALLYIAQYRGYSLPSRLIRWGTRFDYSHSAVYRPESATVFEAWKGGVVEAEPWQNHLPDTPIDIFSLEVTSRQRAEAFLFLTEQLGKKYDFPGVMGWPLPMLRERSDRWFCSELVFAACESIGAPLLRRVEPWRVSPGMLATSPRLQPAGYLVCGKWEVGSGKWGAALDAAAAPAQEGEA